MRNHGNGDFTSTAGLVWLPAESQLLTPWLELCVVRIFAVVVLYGVDDSTEVPYVADSK